MREKERLIHASIKRAQGADANFEKKGLTCKFFSPLHKEIQYNRYLM